MFCTFIAFNGPFCCAVIVCGMASVKGVSTQRDKTSSSSKFS